MTTTMQKEVTMMNGMSMTEMKAKMEAMAADPAMGQTTWRVESRWVGGCRTDHRVEALRIGGQEVMRPFMMQIDEPMELGGTNQFANPQEYLMAAINACMMVGCVAVASMMGIRLTKLEVEMTGEIDLRGFLGIDETVRPGYEGLRQTIRVAGDGTPEQFRKMHEVVMRTSPNYFNITQAVPTESTMVVE